MRSRAGQRDTSMWPAWVVIEFQIVWTLNRRRCDVYHKETKDRQMQIGCIVTCVTLFQHRHGPTRKLLAT